MTSSSTCDAVTDGGERTRTLASPFGPGRTCPRLPDSRRQRAAIGGTSAERRPRGICQEANVVARVRDFVRAGEFRGWLGPRMGLRPGDSGGDPTVVSAWFVALGCGHSAFWLSFLPYYVSTFRSFPVSGIRIPRAPDDRTRRVWSDRVSTRERGAGARAQMKKETGENENHTRENSAKQVFRLVPKRYPTKYVCPQCDYNCRRTSCGIRLFARDESESDLSFGAIIVLPLWFSFPSFFLRLRAAFSLLYHDA